MPNVKEKPEKIYINKKIERKKGLDNFLIRKKNLNYFRLLIRNYGRLHKIVVLYKYIGIYFNISEE